MQHELTTTNAFSQLETLQSSAKERPRYISKPSNTAACSLLFKCVKVTKLGKGHPKLLLVQGLDQTYQAAKYETYISNEPTL